MGAGPFAFSVFTKAFGGGSWIWTGVRRESTARFYIDTPAHN